MSAYPEFYISRAMISCGEMFDFAINDLGVDPELFVNVFCTSSVCKRMQNGEPAFLLGKSGVELAVECLSEKSCLLPEVVEDGGADYGRTPEYWGAWAICYYQWTSGRTFKEIFEAIPWNELMHMYTAMHEADITKFADLADGLVKKHNSDTWLKRIRTAYGCSQSELSRLSGVSLRSIQMYEQRQKDINKAQSVTLLSLARALGCHMEDLMEA